MSYRVVTLAERPEMREQVDRVHEDAWPRFILEGHSPDGSHRLWDPLLGNFPQYQVMLVSDREELIAAGHTIPLAWDGTVVGLPAGWAGSLIGGLRGKEEGRRPNTLTALSIAVSPKHRGQGVAAKLLEAMKAAGARNGLKGMLAPVRPMWKARYPLTPIERYVQWQTGEGLPFDPWIRAHWRMGARPLGVAYRSMIITGTVAQWEAWTGLSFPESGQYVVSGALAPVLIDRERDQGIYEEPNYWMLHPPA